MTLFPIPEQDIEGVGNPEERERNSGMIPNERWTTQWQAASPRKGGSLASQEIVRAQDQRSSEIEI